MEEMAPNERLEKLLDFLPKGGKGLPAGFTSKEELLASLRASKPLTASEFIELQEKGSLPLDSEGGLYIEPSRLFVIKARKLDSGEKVFVNVVTHPAIESPSETEQVDSVAAMRVPISIGEVLECSDKKSRVCQRIDAVISPLLGDSLRTGGEEDKEALRAFSEVLFAYIDQKHKINLAKIHRILQGVSYIGDSVSFQRIRARPRPRVQTISEVPAGEPVENSPDFVIFLGENERESEFDGYGLAEARRIRVEISLPLLVTCQRASLVAAGKTLAFFNKIYQLRLDFPRDISRASVRARFSPQTRILNVAFEYSETEADSKTSEPQITRQVPKFEAKIMFESV